MKRIGVAALALVVISLFAACGLRTETAKNSYTHIRAEDAKELMDTETDAVILDVRTEEEYAQGHIPGAVLIPDYEVEQRAATELLEKEQLILVYCRSGNRSRGAAQTLADLGYTSVKEFGGILDWPYDIEND